MASIAALVAITDTAASSMEHMAARTATWATAVASTTVAEDFMVAGVSWWWGRRSSLRPEPSASHSGTLKRPAFFVPSVRTRLKTPTVTAHAAASSL